MKRIALLLVTLFVCSTMLLFAENNNKSTEMTGWVCNAKCVDQSSGTATCNNNCSEAAGSVVFIDQQGKVLQISNQEMAKPMAGKRCRMKAKMNPNTGALEVEHMEELRGP